MKGVAFLIKIGLHGSTVFFYYFLNTLHAKTMLPGIFFPGMQLSGFRRKWIDTAGIFKCNYGEIRVFSRHYVKLNKGIQGSTSRFKGVIQKIAKENAYIIFIHKINAVITDAKMCFNIVLILVLVASLYYSGFACGANPLKQYITLLNPLSIFQFAEISKKYYGLNWFGHFIPWLLYSMFIQSVVFLIFKFVFNSRRKIKKRRN